MTDKLQDEHHPSLDPMLCEEHFVPKLGLDIHKYLEIGHTTAAHHLIRYEWAACVLQDQEVSSVLDIGCGSGYGCYLMAESDPALSVLGIDYSHAAIEHSRNNYSLPNLTFLHADLHELSKAMDQRVFDCVVCFDVMEHVTHRDIMMLNLLRHMHAKSIVLLSSPVGADVKLSKEWHHELKHSYESLYDFVRRYFRTICRPEEGSLPRKDVFDVFQGSPVSYNLHMNPLMCRDPVFIPNPFGPTPDRRG